MKKIFITNDDGIDSPGLHAAVEAALPLGELYVVAPKNQGTGMGRSLQGNWGDQLHEISLPVDSRKIKAYYCDCSPALAVMHGLNVLFPDSLPDLLISGINYGENLGTTVTQSGTLGAAFQGASSGIPSLAVSMQTELNHYYEYESLDWDGACYFLQFFSKKMLNHTLPEDVDLLKLDVPLGADRKTTWQVTRLSRQMYYNASIKNPTLKSSIKDAELIIKVDENLLEKDSDIHALHVGRTVSITPLSLDFTSRISLDSFDRELRKS